MVSKPPKSVPERAKTWGTSIVTSNSHGKNEFRHMKTQKQAYGMEKFMFWIKFRFKFLFGFEMWKSWRLIHVHEANNSKQINMQWYAQIQSCLEKRNAKICMKMHVYSHVYVSFLWMRCKWMSYNMLGKIWVIHGK